MIIVRLMGGLGNQMFQYAFGKYLAKKNNTVLKLDTSLLETRNPKVNFSVNRDFELDIFNIEGSEPTRLEIELFNGAEDAGIGKKIFLKFTKFMKGYNLYIQKNHDYDKSQLDIPSNTCVVGRWQSLKYFESIQKDIRRDFQFKKSISAKYFKYENLITSSKNAVSLHLRRGDYVTNQFYAETIGSLDGDYYFKGITEIIKHIHMPVFFIFSDNIPEAKEILKTVLFNHEHFFVDVALPDPHDELQLITKCNHHIISNSTFSWWGSWLGSSPESMVIAPLKWAKHKDYIPPHIHDINCIKI